MPKLVSDAVAFGLPIFIHKLFIFSMLSINRFQIPENSSLNSIEILPAPNPATNRSQYSDSNLRYSINYSNLSTYHTNPELDHYLIPLSPPLTSDA